MEAVTCVSIEPAWSFVCPTFQCSQSSITSVLSLYISHARLTSVKVAFNFFLPLISRCIFHRNKRSCIDSGKTQWQWSWAKWKFNISSAPLLFNPSTFLSQSTSPHTFSFFCSRPLLLGWVPYGTVCTVSTHQHCAEVTLRFIEKPPSLSRMGRATTEIAGEFFVNSCLDPRFGIRARTFWRACERINEWTW